MSLHPYSPAKMTNTFIPFHADAREIPRPKTLLNEAPPSLGVALTKKGCEALAACHSATLPSPSHAPNLLPCEVKRTRFTLAKTPGGRTFCTGCAWLHSHMRIEPSWHPLTSARKQLDVASSYDQIPNRITSFPPRLPSKSEEEYYRCWKEGTTTGCYPDKRFLGMRG